MELMIPAVVRDLENSFDSGITVPVVWRQRQLIALWRMLEDNQTAFREALVGDLGDLEFAAQRHDIFYIKNEIIRVLVHMHEWLEPHEDPPGPADFPIFAVHKIPKGTCLILGSWKYPLMYTLLPLIGVIASGNTAIIKLHQVASHYADLITRIFPKYLQPKHYQVLIGGNGTTKGLIERRFAHICFAGGLAAGVQIARLASESLTPFTLELGGKSPAVVTNKADIALAAKLIAWGKFINAGQVCVAPDYALVHYEVLAEFIGMLKMAIDTMSRDSKISRRMDCVLNANHWDRLNCYLRHTKGTAVINGDRDRSRLLFKPTVVTDLSFDDSLMWEEIFGPLLPVICFQTLDEARYLIKKISPYPLILHIMSQDQCEVEHMRVMTFYSNFLVNTVMRQHEYRFPPHIRMTSTASYCGKAGTETFSSRVPLSDKLIPQDTWMEKGDGFKQFLATDLVHHPQ